MELQHVNVKIFAENPQGMEQEKFTPIFQRWIQEQICEELLIDVADYLHVEAGPGIVLVGYEADYSMDNADQRLGLRYNRKTALAGDSVAKCKQALRAALLACQRLENDPLLEGKLKFKRQEFELFINDRALAPNTAATLQSLKPGLEGFCKVFFDSGTFTLSHDPDPRIRFGVKVALSKPFDLEVLLKKLS